MQRLLTRPDVETKDFEDWWLRCRINAGGLPPGPPLCGVLTPPHPPQGVDSDCNGWGTGTQSGYTTIFCTSPLTPSGGGSGAKKLCTDAFARTKFFGAAVPCIGGFGGQPPKHRILQLQFSLRTLKPPGLDQEGRKESREHRYREQCKRFVSKRFGSGIANGLRSLLGIMLVSVCIGEAPARAQSITPAPDGIGTIVNQSGNTYTITGGMQVGENLYQSFQKFGLSQGEIANFLSNPAIANILAQVNGGEASTINGLIRVTGGNSNLFLVNPAGVIFGPDASLNVPAAFYAQPATGLNLNILNGVASGNNPGLGQGVRSRTFIPLQLGSVLSIRTPVIEINPVLPSLNSFVIELEGSQLALANPMTLTTGQNQNTVRVNQTGHVLNLEIQLPIARDRRSHTWEIPILTLPRLLTGGSGDNATTLVVRNGTLQLTGSGILATDFAIAAQKGALADPPTRPQGNRQTPSAPLPNPPPSSAIAVPCIDSGITAIEAQLSQLYQRHLGMRAVGKPELNACSILTTIQQSTGVKPALLYATFVPVSLRAAPETDQLELVLVTSQNPPIRKRIATATRKAVMNMAETFRTEVSDPSKTDSESYKEPAQQLYQWLIAPIEADLHTQNIQTLTFILDSKLSSLPLAALYDRAHQTFLVQKYSIGLMPNLSLTDTRYTNTKNMQVLAMGRSVFTDPNQPPLPAVPVELSLITEIWSGKRLINEQFTLENLKTQRQKRFGILHIATHGEFKSEELNTDYASQSEPLEKSTQSIRQAKALNQSYIQLWDAKLRLNQLRELRLDDPPVELIVFSACRTALGDNNTELGFAGLATRIGVKSAIASLWYVNDAGTMGLVTEFYQQLRQSPIKAEALRQAQIAMLNQQVQIRQGNLHWTRGQKALPANLPRTADFSHPYYWAGFTLIGNPW